MASLPIYSKQNLPPGTWRTLRLRFPKAIRMQGEFVLQTEDGSIECKDGWIVNTGHSLIWLSDTELTRNYEVV